MPFAPPVYFCWLVKNSSISEASDKVMMLKNTPLTLLVKMK